MKKIISTKNAPAAVGPYSQAVMVGDTLYISATGKVVEGGIEAQTEQVLKNIGAILKEAGLDYSNVVKTTCLLADMDNFVPMNGIYAKFFTQDMPARAAFGVVRLPLGVMVEIEAIAVRS